MAKFFPDLEDIKTLKQAPTIGEYYALEILKGFSDEYEVYFQPYVNGYNPDIIVVRKNYGVLIIEVKDWQLVHYHIDESDHWSLKKDNTPIKSPIEQVKAYKNDMYNLSIPSMLNTKIIEKIKNNTQYSYGIVQTAVYFHNETSSSIRETNLNIDEYCPIFGRDDFNMNGLMSHKHIIRKYKSNLFNNETYEEFQRILKPSYHTLEQARKVDMDFDLDPKQKALAISREKQQKIRGVAGSGKTLVLAQRAVNSHIRHGGKVLILTYNITLRNYIHDNINRVRENFHWNNFIINHYHGFMAAEANNNNIQINDLSDYDNEKIFEGVKDKLYKYQAIFIDEIQDYNESWIKIIKKYFLANNGEYVVFGDEKQNIYDTKLDNDKKPYTGVGGRYWLTLDKSYRVSNKILNLAEAFQDHFFKKKYELDKATPKQQTLDFGEESIEYHKLDDTISSTDLSSWIINKLKTNSIQPQDVCILAQSNALLRDLDFEIRKIQKQKTYTTFETQEMYDFLSKKNLSENDFKSEIRAIQKNKRFNFWMNSAGLKLSTINSFKGWEINTLFLVIDGESNFESIEKIYTAITRCRNRLIILNINHTDYDIFFEKNIKSIDSQNKNIIKLPKSIDIERNIVNIDEPNKDNIKSNEEKKKKTIREIIQEDNQSNFHYNFNKVKTNGKFLILVLGEISGDKDQYRETLNSHFSKFNIRANEWDVDFWNNKKLKKTNLKSLKIGQSKYSLIVTAQIHHHSSKGNKEQNLLIELNEMHYIDMIYGCRPQSLLTVDNFVSKVDEYISKSNS